MTEFYLVLAVSFFGLMAFLKTPTGKGLLGEKIVDFKLKSLGKKYDGYAFWDIMLGEEDKSSQIDNILATKKAIYVVEVKNYSGWIYGDTTKKDWYQTIKHVNTYKNKKGKTYTKNHFAKTNFFSPVLQNVTHIKRIKDPLGDSRIPVINVVVFGNGATLKDVKVKHKDVWVINVRDLKKKIVEFENNNEEVWAQERLDILDKFIQHINQSSFINKRKHVKRIKKKHN